MIADRPQNRTPPPSTREPDTAAVSHDPSAFDVASTHLLGRTLLRPFWGGWVERLDLRGGETVLDFGSGSGQLSRRLALSVGSHGTLVCLDISARWLGLARQELADLPWVDFQLGRLSDLPVAAYDVVHVHYVLHDILAGFRGSVAVELATRLRPGGRLAVREPLYYGTFQTDEWLALFRRVGLEVLRQPVRHWWLAGPVVEGVFGKAP